MDTSIFTSMSFSVTPSPPKELAYVAVLASHEVNDMAIYKTARYTYNSARTAAHGTVQLAKALGSAVSSDNTALTCSAVVGMVGRENLHIHA